MVWVVLLIIGVLALGIWKFVASFNEDERRNREALASLVTSRGWSYEDLKGDSKWRIVGETSRGITWTLICDSISANESIPKLRWRLDLPAKGLCLHIQSAQMLKVLRSPTGLAISDIVNGLAKSTIGADFEALTTFIGVAKYTQLDHLLGACATVPVDNLIGAFATTAPDPQNVQAQWTAKGLDVSIKATESADQIAAFISWCEGLAQRLSPSASEIGTNRIPVTLN